LNEDTEPDLLDEVVDDGDMRSPVGVYLPPALEDDSFLRGR
jgi:hypothetical protein